jgi:5-methylcytosine-specific restriction endonuclease McrA
MTYSQSELEKIFSRTNGRCHLCHTRLAFINYGAGGRRGSWEVEHSIPQARGGTHHGNNLYAAHIGCNRQKGTITSRTVRRRAGVTRAPYSATKLKKLEEENGVVGACLLGVLGLAAGPVGAVVLACVGYGAGQALTPRK